MTQLLYYGDSEMFRKLKQLYEIPSSPSSSLSSANEKNKKSEKKSEKSKIRKKTCLENISFMFKENHFQFPPKSSNYHGTNSSCGTNLLFEKMRVFKNVIGILTWNGDEYFPSQTLTLIDLNRSNSIVHVLELSEDEMICEKVVDFKIGDDFIVCHGESSQLYFIGLYHSNNNRGGGGSSGGSGGINYHCEQIPCEKLDRVECVKCGMNSILIKTITGQFYVAQVEKYNNVPIPKLVDLFRNNNITGAIDGHIGDDSTYFQKNVTYFLANAPGWTGSEFVYDWNNNIQVAVINKEKLIGTMSTILIKESNGHNGGQYFIHHILL